MAGSPGTFVKQLRRNPTFPAHPEGAREPCAGGELEAAGGYELSYFVAFASAALNFVLELAGSRKNLKYIVTIVAFILVNRHHCISNSLLGLFCSIALARATPLSPGISLRKGQLPFCIE